MSELSRWRECRLMSRAQFRASGGCLWAVQPNSPGMSIRIPNGTAFKIRTEGPTSRWKLVDGMCWEGHFVVTNGPSPGKYVSSNEAVAATRQQVEASNAYLYIEFQVGNESILADDLRHQEALCWSPSAAELEAMELLRDKVREAARKKGKHFSSAELEAHCERLLDSDPRWMEIGKSRAEGLASILAMSGKS